jgi:hypothetical protein
MASARRFEHKEKAKTDYVIIVKQKGRFEMKQTVEDYKSEFDRPDEYYEKIEMPVVGDYRAMLNFKDKSTALFDKRWQAAKDVIDLAAERLGINPDDHYLYAPINGKSILVEKIDDYFDRSGDKVKLKKRINELENENSVLRSLVGK